MNNAVNNIDQVLALSKRYLTKQESQDLIVKAYQFASARHEHQMRKSGEPYINHLLAVAYILVELQAGPATIAAGLLHDVIEDCGVTKDQVAQTFTPEIAELVEAVTKIGRLSSTKDKVDYAAENHRKIFIAMAKDIRVIIIMLADRLHNMRTLSAHGKEKQAIISRETLEVYSPIAHRLGINTVKNELEDLAISYLEPEKAAHIRELLAKKEYERMLALDLMKDTLSKLLSSQNLPFKMHGRVKSIYSIYKKMYLKNRNFEEIYDIQALRIITQSITNCYEVLGHIHATYRPIPGRFKDYIAMPKPNLYQSLHTTIVADDGNIFEIQIRTQDMEDIAETGIAAHWRYKENSNYNAILEQKEIEEKLHWFRDLVSISSDEESKDAKEYMDSLTKDIFEANVYILTPKGKVIDLPNGATPLDFAYKIHTQVGHSTMGATVNGVLVPLSTVLKTGDVVDIRTSKTATLPNPGWLKIVKTNYARNQIRKALLKYENLQRRDELIEMGKNALDEYLKNDEDIKEIMLQLQDKKFLESIRQESFENFLIALVNKSINLSTIISKLRNETKKPEEISPFSKKRELKASNNSAVIVPGIDSVAISYSQCCSPIPGDEIVGYISKGQGIKVHRFDCSNIKDVRQRIIKIEWNYDYFKNNPQMYYVDVQIRAQNRPQMLVDIMNHLSQQKVGINAVNLVKHEATGSVLVNICIQVNDFNHLQNVMNSLLAGVSGIFSIHRYSKN